jgi:hypothetical protein
MKNLRKVLIAFCLFGYGTAIQAQEAVTASGGDATGSGGTVSYTIGQVAYITNTGAGGIVTQGVQQPYEFFILGINVNKDISMEMLVYPNPSVAFVNLKVINQNLENLSYQLYDINQKLILNQKISSTETSIPMETLSPATYFLKVSDNKKVVKTFKIIKNQVY